MKDEKAASLSADLVIECLTTSDSSETYLAHAAATLNSFVKAAELTQSWTPEHCETFIKAAATLALLNRAQ